MGQSSSEMVGRLRSKTAQQIITIDGVELREMINDSGASVARGDVIMLDAAKGRQYFDTSAGGDDDQVIGMAFEAIGDGAKGLIQVGGPTKYLKVDGTDDIAVGDFISSFTTAKIGQKGTVGSGNCFAIACEAYTTDDSLGIIDAFLFSSPR